MDEEEKKILQEVNEIRKRELDALEEHNTAVAIVGIMFAGVVLVGLTLVGSVAFLRAADPDLARAIFFVCLPAAFLFLMGGGDAAAEERSGSAIIWFGAMLMTIFIAVLCWPRF